MSIFQSFLRPESGSRAQLEAQVQEAEAEHQSALESVSNAERALEIDSLEACDQAVAQSARKVRLARASLDIWLARDAEQRKRELQKQREDLTTRYRALCKKGNGPLVDAAVKALNQLLKAQAEREQIRSELHQLGAELKGVLHELLGSEAAKEECNALDFDLPSASLNRAISRFRDEIKPPAENTPERRAFTAISDALYRATH